MKFLYKIYLTWALTLLSSTAVYAAEAIVFSPQELDYIKTHPVVNYGIFPNSYPIEKFNSIGEHIGLTRDYIDIISTVTGIKFKPVFSNNDRESVTNLQSGKISLLTSTSISFAQTHGLISSVPIFTTATDRYPQGHAPYRHPGRSDGRLCFHHRLFIAD